MCSIWNRSHGTRQLSGKHPLDGETFLSKNKEQTKNWDTTTDKPEEDCEFDFILTSELRFGWGMHLVTEELQIPQH